MTTTEPRAAAAARIGAGLGQQKRAELLGLLRGCFVRAEPWLQYVRERTGHALIGARQWIPQEHISDPVKQRAMGLPDDLVFRTKGELATGMCTEAFADGAAFDFVCGDEVYGGCTGLREFLEGRLQAYVLRVRCSFHLTLARGVTLTCAGVATGLLKDTRPVSTTRLARAAGLRWPVEEDFEFGKGCFGLDQSQVRLYHAIARHTVLVMAALAVCAVTAALLRDRTDTQAPPPARPSQPPPADPGMIPLTVPEITRLLTTRAAGPGHAEHWPDWRRRHQARSRWYHQRARLARDTDIALVS